MGRLALNSGLRAYAHTPTVETAPGFVNEYSIALDGSNDWVGSEEIPETELEGQVSMSVWVKVGQQDRSEAVVGIGNDNYTAGGFEIKFACWKSNQSTGKWWLWQGNGHRSTQNIYLDTSTAEPTVGWHHIVFSDTSTDSSAGVCKVYIDGTEVHEFTSIQWSAPSYTDNHAIVSMGRYMSYFDGKVDEFAIWYRALSASDVTDIYNSGAPTDLSALSSGGPDHWWRMGDLASGSTLPDQGSGTGLDMTLNNGASVDADVPT